MVVVQRRKNVEEERRQRWPPQRFSVKNAPTKYIIVNNLHIIPLFWLSTYNIYIVSAQRRLDGTVVVFVAL